MMIESVDFAQYIIYRTKILKEQDSSISLNMTKLQKILYICDGIMLSYGLNVINEHARAWNYGPVYPKVHTWSSKHPSFFDNPVFTNQEVLDFIAEKNIQRLVDSAITTFGKWSAKDLSNWTHQPSSPWEKALEKGGGIMNSKIEKEDMKHYFKGLLHG